MLVVKECKVVQASWLFLVASKGAKWEQWDAGLLRQNGDAGHKDTIGHPGSKGMLDEQGFKGDIGLTWPKCDAGEQELQGSQGPMVPLCSKKEIGMKSEQRFKEEIGPPGPTKVRIKLYYSNIGHMVNQLDMDLTNADKLVYSSTSVKGSYAQIVNYVLHLKMKLLS